MDWSKYTITVITDNDDDDKVLGILLVEGMEEKEIKRIFNGVRCKLEDCWDIDDLMTELEEVCEQSGKDCIWLPEVSSIGI